MWKWQEIQEMPWKIKMELVKPNIKYKDSFLEAVEEFRKEGNRVVKMRLPEIEETFEKYIERMADGERGVNLPEGYVSHTRLWLVEGSDFIGSIDIRHSLTENLLKFGGHIGYEIRPSKRRMGYGTKMLELALPITKSLGINKALITCNDDNIGSAKIIEKNGGILENKIPCENTLRRRYWITLK